MGWFFYMQDMVAVKTTIRRDNSVQVESKRKSGELIYHWRVVKREGGKELSRSGIAKSNEHQGTKGSPSEQHDTRLHKRTTQNCEGAMTGQGREGA